jgi:hypothetical protein
MEYRAMHLKISKENVKETLTTLDDFLNRDIPEVERKRFISDFQPDKIN